MTVMTPEIIAAKDALNAIYAAQQAALGAVRDAFAVDLRPARRALQDAMNAACVKHPGVKYWPGYSSERGVFVTAEKIEKFCETREKA